MMGTAEVELDAEVGRDCKMVAVVERGKGVAARGMAAEGAAA